MRRKEILAVLAVLILVCSALGYYTITRTTKSVEDTNPGTSGSTSVYEVETVRSIDEDFSDGNIGDWSIWKGHSSVVVQVIDGELECRSVDWAGFCLNRTLEIPRQDYAISYNIRFDADEPPQGNPAFLCLLGGRFATAPVQYCSTTLTCRCLPNMTVEVTHDSGTKMEPPSFTSTQTPPLAYDVNYQFTWQFWGWNDSCRFEIFNKSSVSNLFSGEFTTFGTNMLGMACSPLPDKLVIGDVPCAPNVRVHWYLDNITVEYERAFHEGIILDIEMISDSVNTFVDQVADAWYEDKIREGYSSILPDWRTNPSYYHQNDSCARARDDALASMIYTLARYYRITGEEHHLAVAESYWSALLNHRQLDGGFTFAVATVDYSHHCAQVVLALLELYRSTLNSDYLAHARVTLSALANYTDPETGMVYGRLDRPSCYSIPNCTWITAYSAVAFAESYRLMGEAVYLVYMRLNVGYLMDSTTAQGRVVSAGLGTANQADFTDVARTGASLWALCAAYLTENNPVYLEVSERMAHYLVRSEFTKGDVSFGLWCGLGKDRLNQSDLVYVYPVLIGLWEYHLVNPEDKEVENAFIAGANRAAQLNGNLSNCEGCTLYGMNGMWNAAWNMNDTKSPGWTTGYWAAAGWGTWGYIVFYNWQGCLALPLMACVADKGLREVYSEQIEPEKQHLQAKVAVQTRKSEGPSWQKHLGELRFYEYGQIRLEIYCDRIA